MNTYLHLFVFLCLSSAVLSNDLNMAINMQFVNDLNRKIAPTYFQQFINNFKIPDQIKKIKIGGFYEVATNITDIKIVSIQPDYERIGISATEDKQLELSMENLNASISFKYSLHIPLVNQQGESTIDLKELSLSQKAVLTFNPQQTTNLSITIDKDISINYDQINFVDPTSWLLPKVLNFILNQSIAKAFLANTLRNQIESGINTVLNSKIPSLNVTLPFSSTNYSITPVILNAPTVHYSSESKGHIDLGFTLDIRNSVTQKKAIGVPNIETPKYVGSRQDGQLIMSASLLHKTGWIINDSSLFNKYLISDSALPVSSPVHLYTDQLAIILPQLGQKYGKNRGVYLQLDNIICKQMTVINGRLVLYVGLLMDFIVDRDSNQYPQKSLDECKSCQKALSVQLTTLISLNIANIDAKTIRGLLLSGSLQEFRVVESVLDNLNEELLKNLMSDLVKSVVPLVNNQLTKGFNDPLVDKYGITGLQVRFTQDLVLLSITTDDQ